MILVRGSYDAGFGYQAEQRSFGIRHDHTCIFPESNGQRAVEFAQFPKLVPKRIV
jgi:hypothetical protein